MKRSFWKALLVFALIAAMLCGCGKVTLKEFSFEEVTITLPSNLKDISTEVSGFTFAVANTKVFVFGLREEFSLFESLGTLTLEEYTDLVLSANGMEDKTATQRDGYYTFSFESEVEGDTFAYLAGTFQAEDAFWLIQCSCKADDFAKNESAFIQYLDSVKFS